MTDGIIYNGTNKRIRISGTQDRNTGSTTLNGNLSESWDKIIKYLDSIKDITKMDSKEFLNKYYPGKHSVTGNSYKEIENNIQSELELLNLLNSNNIKPEEYNINDIFTIDKSNCKKIIDDLNERIDIKRIFDSKNLNIKTLFNVDSICKLSLKGAKKAIEFINNKNKKNRNTDNFEKRVQKAYYCEIFNIDEKDINNNSKFIDNFVSAARTVLEKNNNSYKFKNLDSTKQTVLEYTVALNYDWDCIEDFEKFNKKDNDTLIKRLRKLGYLGKNLSEANIRSACKKYFDSFQSLKKPATADPNLTEEQWRTKIFRQTFGKLLINSINDCNKKGNNDLKNILMSIQQEYINEAVTNANTLAQTDEQKEVVANVSLKEGITEHLDKDNTITAAENASQENIDEAKERISERIIANDDSEQINIIKNKIKNNEKLTLEEEKIVREHEILAELMAGSRLNKKLDQTRNQKIDRKIISKISSKSPEKTRILLHSMNKIVNDDKLSETNILKLSKYFDLITNDNLTKIIKDIDAELNSIKEFDNKNDISSNIGLTQKTEDIAFSQETLSVIKEQINEQTRSIEAPDNRFSIENNNHSEKKPEAESGTIDSKFGTGIITTERIMRYASSLSVENIREFSIGLIPLMKQFSELSTSVQNHIKTQLESRSEDEQISNIDQMDKNSDKVDIAIQLKISSDKLKELHLDAYARKSLELQENIA